MNVAIKLNNVTKLYGNSVGVKNISLDVPKGSVFGFLGPNGAGKTTTISMLVDLIRPTSGTVSVFGLDTKSRSQEIRRQIGFLSSDMVLDRSLNGWQALMYYGYLHGDFNAAYVRDLAKRLGCDLHRPIKSLSRGNRQKVGLISALMHKPELLILDEPTSGLDPLMQAEFNDIIAEHQQQGKTAFISSHMLSEVQILCDTMAFIREGELIAVKTAQELAESATKQVRVLSDDKKLLTALEKLPDVKIKTRELGLIAFATKGDVNSLLALLAHHKVRDVTITEADLETIFMEYYEGRTHV